jgi:PAS domain S-box-containing protein
MENREPRQHSMVIFFLIFIVLAAGIIGAGYVYYRNFREQFRTEVKNNLSTIADLKKGELAEWRSQRLKDAEVLFKNPAFSILVQRSLEQPDPTGALNRLKAWLDAIKNAYQYDRVFLLDAQGRERASAPEISEAVAPHVKEALPDALRSDQVTFQDFYRENLDGPVYLSIFVPIYAENDPLQALGLLVFRVDPAIYVYPALSRWPVFSRTGETLIARREGDEVVFLNELRFNRAPILSVRFPLTDTSLPAVQAVLGYEGVMEGIDHQGIPVVAATRAVPGTPWFVVTRVDADEAYAPLRERLFGVALFLGVLLLGVASATGLLWRHQRERYFRASYEAARALNAMSRRQEALLAAVPEIITEVDRNKVYTWTNRAGLEFFGEDVLGKEASFYFEGEQDTYQKIQPLFDGYEGVIYVESRQRRRDGEKRLLAWWCRGLKDEAGRVTGTLASARDITEEKRAEAALRESEAKFKNVFNNSVAGISITTTSGEIFVNTAFCEMLGYPKKELNFRKWQEISHPGDLDMTQRSLDSMLSGKKKSVRFVKRYIHKNGSVIWGDVGIALHRAENGDPLYFITSVNDITEEKRAEEALVIQKRIGDVFLTMPSDEMYYEILKIILEVMESPFGVFGYIDKDGASVVPSMTRQVWDKCQVPQKSITFPRETWGDSSWPRAIREKKANYSNELSAKIPEGHVPIQRHISLPIVCLGKVIGLFQVANKETDYTEADVRSLETIAGYVAPILSTRLQRHWHEEELQEKNDELIRFTYTVSHDLKSPLVTIRTFLGYLEQDMRKPDAAGVDKDLAYIRNAADKASRLLDELLELSRIGRKVNPPVDIPLQEVVKEALSLLAGRIAQRNVKVKVTKEPILLYGDRPRLVEVFQNLVDNAVKFMGDTRTPHVEIGVEQVGDGTVLFVRDNGIGIDPRYQPKIFDLFEKIDPGSEGTGIGLALVKRIVEVQGGRIWVESAGPGQGATFRFTLAKTRRESE